MEEQVRELWQEHWDKTATIDDIATFYGKYLRRKRLQILRKILLQLNPNYSIIDMGCGGGGTLKTIREAGYKNSIGIDYIDESLSHCQKLGFEKDKDVFLMDAKATMFSDRQFDIVFSEGLWEHFIDPTDFMAEAARVADKYILIIQPNHFSFVGRLLKIGWEKFSSKRGGVREYSFRLSYFKDGLKKLGFDHLKTLSTAFREQAVMLFVRGGFEIPSKVKLWDKHYRVYKPTRLGRIMYASHRRVLQRTMRIFPKDITILDVGCGKGSTLSSFREWGFCNSIGIDLADSGLEICQQIGLELDVDVFKIDATATPYKDREFDLIFSEGILEHYMDYTPFIKEMCRLANKYIVLVQPNHYSVYGRLIKYGWLLLRQDSGGIEELTYKLSDFYRDFKSYGFKHIKSNFTPLRENVVLVFERG